MNDDEITRALASTLRRQVVPLGAAGDFHNQHFRTSDAGVPLFVKVLDDAGYAARAVAAAPVAERLFERTPRLLDHGVLGPGRWWAAYEWRDFTPITMDPATVEAAGAMVGRLHAETQGAPVVERFHLHDLDADLEDRADALAEFDPAAADRVRALRDRWGPITLPGTAGLIHGDLGWRNFGLDAEGEICWYDWENLAAGSALIDFGKLADLDELGDPAVWDAFWRGYGRHAEPLFPWPDQMRLVRLWTNAGVLVYSLALGLDDFAAHGYRTLNDLGQL